ncbi:hypothetical protein NQ317_012732 [Molorchus minor]|uniref:Vitellogenin domain-containing protein n=1 Tax=Molorchus minor TaxID=1323400 RepID=A0ABQ9JNI7_9CUCU|nr:hypothetical protein NQ317_012732 [Molorchus minor]
MLPSINSYSILYILFAWFLGMCYGFVLLSSAAGQNGDLSLFEPGESLTYKFHSTVLLNDRDGHSRSAGFYIAGDVIVQTVWGNNNEKLIKVELISPQLNIKSRKAPSPDGFIPHSSRLDSFPNKPFYIAWNAGAISKILLPKGEELSLANLKKGIASLLQVRLLNGRSQETDASGHCTATYTQTSQTKLLKTKTNCISPDFRYIKSTDEIMGTIVESLRQTEYELAPTNYLKSIKSEESHQLYLSGNKQIGNYIKAEQILDFVKRREIETINAENMEGAVQVVERTSGVVYTQETLFTEQEPVVTEDQMISFSKEVDSVRDYLKTENMGSLKPAKAFLRLVSVARTANRENILQALESKKNKDILYQLYDVLGYTQTQDSYEAALKKLHFQKNEQVDLSERYLWALSFASQPNPEIIKDLLKKYTKVINIPDKVKETMILTIASMVNRLLKLPENQFHQKRCGGINHKQFGICQKTTNAMYFSVH